MIRLKGTRATMFLRALLALGVIVCIGSTSGALAEDRHALRALLPIPSALAAEVGGLSFSESVNEQARPINPKVDFPSTTMRIWISFNYYEFKSGNRVKYVIRANGAEWQTGDVACCVGEEGRFAFPIERERDREFGGAGYEVVILIGNVEASRGNFVVQGTGGFDNDNACNPDATHRGNLSLESRKGNDC
jgi:hypothetical protein